MPVKRSVGHAPPNMFQQVPNQKIKWKIFSHCFQKIHILIEKDDIWILQASSGIENMYTLIGSVVLVLKYA